MIEDNEVDLLAMIEGKRNKNIERKRQGINVFLKWESVSI